MQKIMFNDKYGLTAAVLQGRKTMTRRTCKDTKTNQPLLDSEVVSLRYYPDENLVEAVMRKGGIKVAVPQYKIGKIVAVAQSYKDLGFNGDEMWRDPKHLVNDGRLDSSHGLNNKMFVRAAACTTRIRITDFKVERLQDISDEDCLKDGIFQWGDPFHEDRVEDFGFFGATKHYLTPKEAFAALIDKVSGRGTWVRNPWVFAYSFELVK